MMPLDHAAEAEQAYQDARMMAKAEDMDIASAQYRAWLDEQEREIAAFRIRAGIEAHHILEDRATYITMLADDKLHPTVRESFRARLRQIDDEIARYTT